MIVFRCPHCGNIYESIGGKAVCARGGHKPTVMEVVTDAGESPVLGEDDDS